MEGKMSKHDNNTPVDKEDILEKQKGEHNLFTFTEDAADNHKKIYGGDNLIEKAGFTKTTDTKQQLELKRKQEYDETLKLLQDGDKAFDDLLSNIQNKIDEYNSSRDRENRLNEALKNHDLATLQQILIQDYHRNPDEVHKMDWEEASHLAEGYVEQEKFTQATLKHEIIELSRDYDEKHGLTDDQKLRLQELISKSDIEGIDFNRSFSEVRDDLNSEFAKEGEILSFNDTIQDKIENPLQTGLTDPFNVAANNEMANPFDLEQEKSAPDPFSSAPSSPNPFG